MEQLEITANNEANQIESRKLRTRLRIIGTGVIVMSVWSLFKSAMFYISGYGSFAGLLSNLVSDLGGAEGLTLGISLTIVAVDLAIRLYSGFTAISVGKGNRGNFAFIICCCVLILSGVISIVMWCYSLYTGLRDLNVQRLKDLSGTYLIVETTSLIMTVELLVYTLRLRKMTVNGEV